VYGFKYLGRARRATRNKQQQRFLWALGAALFANVVAFMGIAYIDQTQVVWYALLAAISAAAVVCSKREVIPVQAQKHSDPPNWLAQGSNLDAEACNKFETGTAGYQRFIAI
jgi:hypothetical protein